MFLISYNYTIEQLVVSVVDFKWQFMLREVREILDCREMVMNLSIHEFMHSLIYPFIDISGLLDQ